MLRQVFLFGFWRLLGLSLRLLGLSWASLGTLLAPLGHFLDQCIDFWSIFMAAEAFPRGLGPPKTLKKPMVFEGFSKISLFHSWTSWGPVLGGLGPHFGGSWAHLGSLLGYFGVQDDPKR